jgi:thioredoxin-like negative regulator of GroEL
MTVAADFAFRQAWALCPYSPEAVYCYVNVLLPQNRFDDAVRVAEAFAALPQNKDNEQAAHLLTQLKQMQTEHPPKPGN